MVAVMEMNVARKVRRCVTYLQKKRGLSYWMSCIVAAGFLAVSTGDGWAAKPSGQYKRWAVIATDNLNATGLTDLITAELSQLDSLELVERQQLAAVTKELELSAYFGSEATTGRLKLGQLLKADALLLLSLEERDKQQFVKLVVADCRYGARLRSEYLPFMAERVDGVAEQCVNAVRRTRAKFAGGIEQLIGVTHFLSKNLTHDFDHLQSGYTALLQSALGEYPGVAVLEIDEARAIGRELNLASAKLKTHVVPLFVEGEFQIAPRKSGNQPKASFLVRVNDGKQPRDIVDESSLELAEVTDLLMNALPKTIVRLANKNSNRSFNRAEQRDLLVARADAFSQFGAYEQSTGMREAALLLKPEETELRLRLIGDYRGWLLSRHREDRKLHTESMQRYLKGKGAEPQATWDKTHAERLGRFRLIFLHIEQLIHQQALNPREAETMLRRLSMDMSTLALPGERKRAETHAALDEFFWRTFPQFVRLDAKLRNGEVGKSVRRAMQMSAMATVKNDGRSAERQLDSWTHTGIYILSFLSPRIGGSAISNDGWDDRKTLDNLHRFLTQVVPRTMPLSRMAGLTLADSPFDLNGMIASGRLSADEVRDFYLRLQQSKQPLNEFYARCGLLSLQLNTAGKKKPDQQSLQQADELLAIATQFAQKDRHHTAESGTFVRFLNLTRNDIRRVVGVSPAAKRHALPRNLIAEGDRKPRVRFRQIAGVATDWIGLLKCTEALDVAWSFNAVFVMQEPGVARTIYDGGKSESIFSVVFDGHNIWIASMNKGVQVFAPNGNRLAMVQADLDVKDARNAKDARDAANGDAAQTTLPPYDRVAVRTFVRGLSVETMRRPLHLHVIGPGKCVLIGQFGKLQRIWFAAVELRSDATGQAGCNVNVFHSATKEVGGQSVDASDGIGNRFDPKWFTEFRPVPSSAERFLLIGRQFRDAASVNTRWPLAIDLDSLAVSIFPHSVHPNGKISNGPRFGYDGRLIHISYEGFIDLYSRIDAARVDGPSKTSVKEESSDTMNWKRSTMFQCEDASERLRPQLVAHAGFLYLPGSIWRRIDRKSARVEQLSAKPVPNRHRFEHYSVSGHYGLVAWNRGDQLYRISIDAANATVPDLEESYPFVPVAVRANHDKAVRAIRALGGIVATEWGDCKHRARRADYRWRTIVFLPIGWKGGDDGLEHLKALYNLCDLYLVQARVTDKGMRTIGRLPTLETLCIVETDATNKGLAELKAFSNLSYCRIEGTVGGNEFTDAGLEGVGHLPRLERLALYGSGFTDDGLAHLKPLRRLRELFVLDTAITKTGLSELKKSKLPYFRSYENDARRLRD